MIWNIDDKQNTQEMLDLLAARNYNYKLPNTLIFLGFIFSAFLSMVSLLQVWIPSGYAGFPAYLAAISLVYTVHESWLIDPISERRSIRGAELIDEFDRELFNIEKNQHTRDTISRASVIQDAKTIDEETREYLKGWYSYHLGRLPIEYAALVAQYTATGYDQALRKSYITILQVAIFFLIAVILTTAMVSNMSFHEFVIKVMVPFLPLLNWCIKNYVRTKALVVDQDRSLKLMDVQWAAICRKQLSGQNLIDTLRDNQSDIFRRRCSSVHIFPMLYKILRPKLEGHAHRNAEVFAREYEGSRT